MFIERLLGVRSDNQRDSEISEVPLNDTFSVTFISLIGWEIVMGSCHEPHDEISS